jgi:hypothetical protein
MSPNDAKNPAGRAGLSKAAIVKSGQNPIARTSKAAAAVLGACWVRDTTGAVSMKLGVLHAAVFVKRHAAFTPAPPSTPPGL